MSISLVLAFPFLFPQASAAPSPNRTNPCLSFGRSITQVVAVPTFGTGSLCVAVQSMFSMRIRKSSLSFLIPVSRIKMTMSRKSSRVRCRHLQVIAPAIRFFSASASSRRCLQCSFIILSLGAWPITFHSSALCSIRRSVRKAQLAFAAEPAKFSCSVQSPVIWSIRNTATDVACSNRQPLR